MKSKILKVLLSLSFLLCLSLSDSGHICSAELMEDKFQMNDIELKLNRLEEIFQTQKQLMNESLENSKMNEIEYNDMKLKLQALELQLKDYQKDLSLREEDSKRLEILLTKVSESLEKLEKLYEETNRRHKKQKIVVGVGAVILGVGIGALIHK